MSFYRACTRINTNTFTPTWTVFRIFLLPHFWMTQHTVESPKTEKHINRASNHLLLKSLSSLLQTLLFHSAAGWPQLNYSSAQHTKPLASYTRNRDIWVITNRIVPLHWCRISSINSNLNLSLY